MRTRADRIRTALLVGLLAVTAVAAQPAAEPTSAEVRIAVPDAGQGITVEPTDRRVVVELPRGAVFPMDLVSSTGGLVRHSDVEPAGEGRTRLVLDLSAGYLARVAFEAEALVLTFEARRRGSASTVQSDEQYLLGPRDRIAITVHNQPDMGSTLTVSSEGTITLPMLGEVRAEGLSTGALADRLEELLGRSYLVDPQVDVTVEEFRSQWVMVSGEVLLGGRVALRGGTRLKEVLSEAGGFKDSAGQQIVISRKSEDASQFETVTVERQEFEAGLQNPVLRHGDIVDVPRAAYCYIQGEVRSPGRVPIERGTTLLKAITLVGGLTEWADRKSVRILRGEGAEAGESVVNLKRIQAGKEGDPVLRGGEVIVVKRRFF